MRPVRLVRSVRLVGPVLLVVACSSGVPPVPGVPAVPGVIDARDVAGADPCTLAGPATLAAAGVDGPGTAGPGPDGPGCTWRGAGGELTVSVFEGGLGTLARGSDPTTARVRLAGRPALETFTGSGEFCQYDVAVADDQVLALALEGGRPDSCTVLQGLAPALLDGLPPG